MKIIFDILGFLSIIGAILVTTYIIIAMSDTAPLVAIMSALSAAGYLYLVFSAAKNKKSKTPSTWSTKAISGFFLLLFINFLGCVGLMPQ